jgi:hypothetical protein
VATLLTDGALADRVSSAARARAGEFSAERMAERTLAVYRRVLAATWAGPKRDSSAPRRARVGRQLFRR